jgi:hypothetical protein
LNKCFWQVTKTNFAQEKANFWNIPLPEIQMATFAIGKMLAFAADAFDRV